MAIVEWKTFEPCQDQDWTISFVPGPRKATDKGPKKEEQPQQQSPVGKSEE